MLIAKLWNDGEPDILPVASPDCYITVICLHLLAYFNTGRYVCASHCVFYAHISLNLNIIYERGRDDVFGPAIFGQK